MRLVVLEEPNLLPGAPQPNVFDLWYNPARPILTVGRKVGNDIVLADSSVSRHHLELEVRDDGLLVRDVGSSNGTFIDSQPLKAQNQVFMRPGSKLRVGSVLLLLETTSPYPSANGAIPATQTTPLPYGAENQVAARQGAYPVENARPAPAYPASQVQPEAMPLNRNGAEAGPVRRDPSDLHPPEVMDLISQSRLKPPPRRRGPNGWVLALIVLVIFAAIAAAVLFLVQFINDNNTVKLVPLPLNAFSSPANADSALGILVQHPSNWERTNVDESRVMFTKPDSVTAAFTIEKPPSRSISNPNLSPEQAVKEYISNVTTNGKNPRVLQAPGPTRLKDGTDAWIAKAVFTTNEDNVTVIDYTITVLSFRCNNSLYFVSAAEEGRLYNGTTQQDLEAAIANVSCK